VTSADETHAPTSQPSEQPGVSSSPAEATAGFSQSVIRGRFWIAAAAVLWSTSGLFAKSPIFADWSPDSRGVLLAFWRALFAGALLIPLVRRPRWDVMLIPLCFSFAAMNATYLSAMTLTTAANAIWLQSTAPWWVFLAGVLVGREPLTRAERLPLFVGGIGLGIIFWFEVQGQARWGVICGLASGMTYAGVVLSLRALRGHDAVWLVVVSHLGAALAMLPVVLWLDVWPRVGQLPVLAAFGFFQMAVPYVFFARGLRSITSQEATAIGLLEPLLLPLWVYLRWDESPAPWTLVGGALILSGLVMRYAVPLARKRW
jgi:drug/metabolite transporter (DMT)-like permease